MTNQFSEMGKLTQKYNEMGQDASSFAKNDGTYNLSYLYKNLQKNHESVQKRPHNFPTLGHSFDGEHHSFSNSPEFSRQFNRAMPDLSTLASYDMHFPTDETGKNFTTPCLHLDPDLRDETQTEFLKRKKPREGYGDMRVPQITQEKLDSCEEPACYSCKECKPHQDVVLESLRGMVHPDKVVGNAMRSLHAKNLMTALDSWACHLDSRGNNAASCNAEDHVPDRRKHDLLASSLRVISSRLKSAYQSDYEESNHTGGGIHRDHFGDDYGKNKGVY